MKKSFVHVSVLCILALAGIMIFWQSDPLTSMTLELNTAGSVYIQWKTTAVNRNALFEIERSTDRTKWTTIERIPSGLNTQFNFLDARPEKGINYYRIKMIRNSTAAYSNIYTLEIGDEKDLHIWPQPATNILHVRVSFLYGTLEIIDASGRTAQKRSVTGYLTDIPITQLPEGIYFLRIKDGDKMWVKKFVKQ